MPSGLPARVAVVCTLLFGVAIAHAERRQVAVIDLSGDPLTASFAAQFNPVLLGHPDLSPIQDATIPPELYGEFRDNDFTNYQSAMNSKQTAETALAAYRFEIAQQSALNGQEALRESVPTPPVLLLYSQLAFLRAQALLGTRQAADAPAAFALAHRLDPKFVPDAARYLPDVVEAYDNAKRRWTGKGKLEIAGTGNLFIDGKDSGKAPLEVELDAGPHIIWVTGADRDTAASYALVEPNRKVKLQLPPAPANMATKVRRARAALRFAGDPAVKAVAMRALADLVKVNDAVLLSSANGRIIVQTWTTTDHRPGFSSLRERANETPAKLLESLVKPKDKTPPPKDDDGPKKLVDTRKWYEKRPYQASVAVGVVAVIIGAYYVYQAVTDDGADLNLNPQWDSRVMRW